MSKFPTFFATNCFDTRPFRIVEEVGEKSVVSRGKREVLIELLVVQTQAGNARSMAELIDLCQPEMSAYAQRLLGESNDAKDAVQEAWLSVIRGIHRLKDPEAFRAWALRIVHHKSMDIIRSRVRERDVIATATDELSKSATESTTVVAITHDDSIEIRRIIERMPVTDQTLIKLFYENEMSTKEISFITGSSMSAIKAKLYSLRQKIKLEIEREK